MTPVDERVRVIGPEPSGFAEMIAAIVRGNLQRRPELTEHLDGPPGVVRISATDVDVVVCLEFRDGTLRVYTGPASPADVEITGDSETLTGFAAVPQIGPLPSPFHAAGRRVIAKALRREVEVRGAVRGRRLLDRMRALLTTDP